MDNSAGCGAFIDVMKYFNVKKIMADIDPISCKYLKELNEVETIMCDNSLLNVSREKYEIKDFEKLIIIGNPPYNDVTSKSKKKIKKENQINADLDLLSRDLGVTFLKSYNKLNAEYICVLHPLSYLIKETNFNSLKEFKENYKLIKGTIFSSEQFYGTKKTNFPIIVALYKKEKNGMSYEDILNFEFEIKDDNRILKPILIHNTDKIIRKYPPKKNENKTSDIGIYFYTFRDINSLKTSKSFIYVSDEEENKNVIVNKNEFYKYCYLNIFKSFFNSNYIFGNFSPIYEKEVLNSDNKFIKQCIIYSIKTNKDLQKSFSKSGKLNEILSYYKINYNEIENENLFILEQIFATYFRELQVKLLKENKNEF